MCCNPVENLPHKSYGHVDAEFRENMTKEEAQQFVRKAISHAMARDGSSGGVIRMVVIDKAGVRKDFPRSRLQRGYGLYCGCIVVPLSLETPHSVVFRCPAKEHRNFSICTNPQNSSLRRMRILRISSIALKELSGEQGGVRARDKKKAPPNGRGKSRALITGFFMCLTGDWYTGTKFLMWSKVLRSAFHMITSLRFFVATVL